MDTNESRIESAGRRLPPTPGDVTPQLHNERMLTMLIVTQSQSDATGDVAEIFDAYRLICIARNYPDIPESLDDLPAGTQETIRDAAKQRAYEREKARRARRRSVAIGAKPDPHATVRTVTETKPLRKRIAERRCRNGF